MARTLLWGGCGVLLLAVAWEAAGLAVRLFYPPIAPFWPSSTAIVARGGELLNELAFWQALLATNVRVLLALVCAMGAAVLLSFGLYKSERARFALSPVIDYLRYIPVAAIVPVSIILFGINDLQKVAILVFGTVFYSTLLILGGFLRVPTEYVELARVAGYSSNALFWRVIWPGARPDLWQALRVSAGICWSYILVAEIVAADRGLGFLIIRAQRFLEMDMLFALVVVTGLVGLAYDRIIALLARLDCPWAGRLP